MQRDKSDLENGLLRKGFVPTHGGADHRYFIYATEDGKKARGARTKTSHGKGFDIGDNLLGEMARQVGLTKKKFLELVDCPLSREEYEAILRSSGKV